MRGSASISLHHSARPRVLLLGNGILRLAEGRGWSELLHSIRKRNLPDDILHQIPYSMQPEALCGYDIETIRRSVAKQMEKSRPSVSPQLERLLAMDFDCILTTNYTYEIEEILLQKDFNDYQRRKALRTFGDTNRQINLQTCYEFPRGEKSVQVWHVHGDAMRANSLILSYHSYAKSLALLWDYSQQLRNSYLECQQAGEKLPVRSWLEWFLAGDVYSVGFGWDFSEMDLWWALERSARENGVTGEKHIFFFTLDSVQAKAALLENYGAQVHIIPNDDYSAKSYDRMLDAVNQQLRRVTLHS